MTTARATIPDPILNSPFEAPQRYWKTNDDGDLYPESVEGRRPSRFFVPVRAPKKRGGSQLSLAGIVETPQQSPLVALLRDELVKWRTQDYADKNLTEVSRQLLRHWKDRTEQRLFFCQLEAVETAIFLAECLPHLPKNKSVQSLLSLARAEGLPEGAPALPRLAFKMATGTGKTTVMAMLIAWQVLNAAEHRHANGRYSTNILVVAPGITIRDRLQELDPAFPANIYESRDLVPTALRPRLARARVTITNFHTFKARALHDRPGLAGKILQDGVKPKADGVFEEDDAQRVARLTQKFDPQFPVVVLNDEAHHCYHKGSKPVALDKEDREVVASSNQKAGVWIGGLDAIQHHWNRRTRRPSKTIEGISTVFDLSATPQYIHGSGYDEGTLFPWVVSDFSLIDAIEAGLVKIPRVPVDADLVSSGLPLDRAIWDHVGPAIRERIKSKTQRDSDGQPQIPQALETSLDRLYGDYAQAYARWELQQVRLTELHPDPSRRPWIAPPVFIVVCTDTDVSSLVYDWIAGWQNPHTKRWQDRGKFPLFSNVEEGNAIPRKRTILVDSEALESDEGLSPEFKRDAKEEIEAFRGVIRAQKGHQAAEEISDKDLLREVLNSVGRRGRLGEGVRCVVSVQMLTEGWDANSVTHVFGLRAFTSQLLCEQVVGRALRRRSYALNDAGRFDPEFADVYGVPFRFVPCASTKDPPREPPPLNEVRCDPARVARKPALRVTFPNVVGYSLSAPTQRLRAVFSEEVSVLPLSTAEITTESVVATPLGAERVHRDQFQERYTLGQVDLTVAVEVMKRFAGDNTQTRADRLPEIVQVVRAWREEGWLRCADGIVPQHLMIQELSQRAAACVLGSIQVAHADESVVLPVFGVPRELSTDDVSFVTVKPVWETRDDRCALTHVVADTDSWEQKVAQCLEDMPEVVAYVKNERLGFTIPYVMDGIVRRYLPDFIAKVDDGNGHGDLLHVVIEVTGQKRSSKRVKVATALATWIPALQSARRTGQGIARWSFVEVDDVTETVSTLRAHLHHVRAHTVERLAMHRLLQFMPEVLVDPEELDAVHTYDGEGRPLTLRAWIAQEVQGIAPVAARALSRKLSRPRAPDEIDDDLMAQRAERTLRSAPRDRVIMIAGRGSFTPEQLVSEIKRRTDLGLQQIGATRRHAVFLEEAARLGKLRERKSPREVR
jgi:type III restriction enzyme